MCRQGIIPKQKEFFPKGNRGFPRTGVISPFLTNTYPKTEGRKQGYTLFKYNMKEN